MGVGVGKVSQAEERACAKVLRQEMPHFIDEKTKEIGNLTSASKTLSSLQPLPLEHF